MPPPHPCLAPLPAPLGLRFRALLGLGFVPPPEPRPCAHCASIAYALLPAVRVPLCRHRADPESSSRSLPSGSPARIAPTACRHPHPSMSPPSRSRAHRPPHRAHRVPTSASPPPSLSSRCGGPRALAGKNRAVCIPFSPNARKRPLSWQHPPEMHAFRDQDGNILALCIHSRVQSGDLGYMARESCRQGPFSRRGTRNHAWREDVASAARPFSGSSLRSGGTGFAPCDSGMRHAAWPNGLCALRRGPGLFAACAPPCHLACARRGLRPLPSARVHRRRLIRAPLRRPHCVHRAQPSATPPIAVGVSRLSVSSCRPRAAHAAPTGPRP